MGFINGVRTWEQIKDKPATLKGYGIGDAYTKSEVDKTAVDIAGTDITGFYNTPTYCYIATLPASTPNTRDRLIIDLHGGGWQANQCFVNKITLSNRDGLNTMFESYNQTSGITCKDRCGVKCYKQTDGSINVYLYLNSYVKGMIKVFYTFLGNGAVTLGAITTSVPDGEEVWDSATATPNFSTVGNNIGIDTTSPTVFAGYGGISLNGTKGGVMNFQTGNVITGNISGDANGLYITSKTTAPVFFAVSNATKFAVSATAFYPTNNNAYTIGTSSLMPSQIYAASATINTSDRDAKTDITETTLGLDFINLLRPVEFKYKVRENRVTTEQDGTEPVEIEPAIYDEEGNVVTEAITEERPKYKEVVTPLPGIRTHLGLIAQDVEAVLDRDIGVITKDKVTGHYGLRYEEFVAPLIKAIQELSAIGKQQTAKIDEQAARIAELEAR